MWDRIDRSGGPDSCWPWTGAKSRGYGVVNRRRLARSPSKVPRLVLAEKLGRPIAPGLCALHTCDNPGCCNPAHLYEGTKADNVRDMVARGRASGGARGERHNQAKLTAADVAEIRAARGETQRALAQRFGVTQGAVSRILLGVGWV